MLQQDPFITNSPIRGGRPTALEHVFPTNDLRLQLPASSLYQCLPILSDAYTTPIWTGNNRQSSILSADVFTEIMLKAL